MNQAQVNPLESAVDDEVRQSIRVMQRERSTKLALVIISGILGIGVLFLVAYLGFGAS